MSYGYLIKHVIKTNLAGAEANLYQTTIHFPAAAVAAVLWYTNTQNCNWVNLIGRRKLAHWDLTAGYQSRCATASQIGTSPGEWTTERTDERALVCVVSVF